MELNVKLTHKQEVQLQSFNTGSWLVERVQGTGLKFWRFTWTTRPDWQGTLHTVDGRTFSEMITLAQGAK